MYDFRNNNFKNAKLLLHVQIKNNFTDFIVLFSKI